jgi:hypothetical protein
MNEFQQHDQTLPAMHDDIHDDMDDDALLPLDRAVGTAMARALCDTLMLWRLCLSARCRRNGRCKGDPQACLAIGGALLSDDVVNGGAAFLQAKADGLSFDEAFAQCPDEFAAFGEWARRIECNPARQRSPTPRRPQTAKM